VSNFRLDRFEVTVGRFRAFVNGFPGNRPTEGAGAHPLIPNSGWSLLEWEGKLPMNKTELRAKLNSDVNATWTDAPGTHENLPINDINWYEAFAFCVWDGGRLPTEAEWNYAAAGGAEQRVFPWSNPPSSQTINNEYAVYFGQMPGPVGSTSPRGDGKWRQADLAGSLAEWALDWYEFSYDSSCSDCANLSLPVEPLRVQRGGSWYNNEQDLLTSTRNYNNPNNDDGWRPMSGIRCARQP
jgi:formylglycine-generating enzyme required for sulfatase activity